MQRRAYFRTNNVELKLEQQYLLKLQAVNIAPVYVRNGSEGEEEIKPQPPQLEAICIVGAVDPATPALPSLPPPLFSPHAVATSAALADAFSSASSRVPIVWSTLPSSLAPSSHMNSARALRKQDQLQNMIQALRALLAQMAATRSVGSNDIDGGAPRRRPILVDFCCGSGHLGFPIAFLFPWCDIILLEHNATAIAKAHQRLAELQAESAAATAAAAGASPPPHPWTNVRIVHAGLQEFDESFDVGIGIHACGWLSDVIQIKCIQQRAAYLLAPCCIGKLKVS